MISGGIKLGEMKLQYEIFVKSTDSENPEFLPLLSDIHDFEAAKQYKEFLTTRRGFAAEDVVIQQVTWIATTIGVVG
jgi:hypothetical protein